LALQSIWRHKPVVVSGSSSPILIGDLGSRKRILHTFTSGVCCAIVDVLKCKITEIKVKHVIQDCKLVVDSVTDGLVVKNTNNWCLFFDA